MIWHSLMRQLYRTIESGMICRAGGAANAVITPERSEFLEHYKANGRACLLTPFFVTSLLIQLEP
jgi:hypothetical protein